MSNGVKALAAHQRMLKRAARVHAREGGLVRIAAQLGAYPLPRLCAAAGLPPLVPEHRFAPPRRWKFDFAMIAERIAVEIEGGSWSGGRHTRGDGFLKDMEKYNAAVLLGWRVLRYSPRQMGNAVRDLSAMVHGIKVRET